MGEGTVKDENAKVLIKECTEILTRQQQEEQDGNMAQSPVILLFLGNVTHMHLEQVKTVLDANLKNSSFFQYLWVYYEEEVCHVVNIASGEHYKNVADAIEASALSLLGTSEQVFKSKRDMYFECILSTLEVQSEKYYEEYLSLKESHNYNMIKTLYLMIDQQNRAREERAQILIDRILETAKAQGNHSNVYLLSNLLYDGSILMEDRIWQNYRLVADLILLGNTADSSNSGVYAGMVHDGIMTAAYSYIGKPLDDIAKISLYYLMEKIYEREAMTVQKLTEEEMTERLRTKFEIGQVGIRPIEEIFQSQFQNKLPDARAFQWLPWKEKKSYKYFSRNKITDWQEVNSATCGVLDLYYQTYYEKMMTELLENAAFVEECRNKIKEFIQNKFSFFEILEELKTNQWREALQNTIIQSKLSNTSSWAEMLGSKAEFSLQQKFCQWAEELIEDCVRQLWENAEKTKNAYRDVMEEVRKSQFHFNEEKGHMEHFYENEVEQFLLSEEFLSKEKSFQAGSSLDEILERICSLFRIMVNQRSIYKEPFEREEAQRLGSMPEEERSRIIRKRLSEDVSNHGRIHLNYGYRENRSGSFCLVNAKSVYMNELTEEQRRGGFILFNLNRRDCLEMVELYKLPETERIILKD